MQVPVEKIVVREREVPVEKVVEQLEEQEVPVPVEKVSLDAYCSALTSARVSLITRPAEIPPNKILCPARRKTHPTKVRTAEITTPENQPPKHSSRHPAAESSTSELTHRTPAS